jgi:hypothetical protein
MALTDFSNRAITSTSSQDTIQWNHPQSSRHRGILDLRREVNVYDMRSSTSETVADIVESTRLALPLFGTTKIATQRLLKREDGTGLADLEVTICGVTDSHGEENANFVNFIVSIPQKWTPRLYLATINRSITDHHTMTIEKVSNLGYSINEVHAYFYCNMKSLHESLLIRAAYIGVSGGERTSTS